MKTFNTVDDIWEEVFDTCTTIDQIYYIISNIPQKFGNWWTEVVEENELEVTNEYWDKNQEEMVVESRTFEVESQEVK